MNTSDVDAAQAILDDSELLDAPPEALSSSPLSECDGEWLRQLHRDLEVLERPPSSTATTLADALDRTQTRGGRACFRRMLSATPCTDGPVLGARRASLLRLRDRMAQCPAAESAVIGKEADVIWFFRLKQDEALSALVESAYFGTWPLSALNRRSPLALAGRTLYTVAVSPLVGLLSPIVYFVVPYLVLRFGTGMRIGFVAYLGTMLQTAIRGGGGEAGSSSSSYAPWARGCSALLSLVMYFHSALSSVQASSALRSVCGSVGARVAGAAAFMRASDARAAALKWTAEDAAAWSLPYPLPYPANGPADAKVVADWWRAPLATARATGDMLCSAAGFDLASAAASLQIAYGLDAVASIVRATSELELAVAEFDTGASAPSIDARGLRHPCLPRSARGNDWKLGAAFDAPNALLTGPNAGGKSTLMKSALAAVLTSQTIGVAACASIRLTPFATINSHINVSDCAGSESLFQAEMTRAHRVIRALPACSSSSAFAFVALDEIFSSTNPVEGIAAATAVAKRIAADPRAMCLVSTHFVYICRKLVSHRYANFCMPAQLDAGTGAVVRYPYRLQAGVCRQRIALELMRRSGFDADVIEDALAIQAGLLVSSPNKVDAVSKKKCSRRRSSVPPGSK